MIKIYKFCYFICILLIVGFVIRLSVDFIKYDETTSFPIYYFIIERVVEFLLPSVLVYFLGKVIEKKK